MKKPRERVYRFRVNDDESEWIENKFRLSACDTLSDFFRTLIMYGMIVKYDEKQLKRISDLVKKTSDNFNQIAVRVNSTNRMYAEDIALMRALPGMIVINPCDYNQTKNATIAAARYDGPVYLRFGRPNVPNFTPADEEFVIGKAQLLNEGKDVTIVACGHLVWEALQAAEALEAEGISAEVINMATVKPLDEAALLASAAKTKAMVVAEEHNMAGGLGEAVAGVLARTVPTPVEFINGQDRFGQSGTPSALLDAYGLDAKHIAEAVKKVLERK